MNLNYTPQHITEEFIDKLTARQKLAHIRKVIESVKNARNYWPPSKWDELITDLESQELHFADEVQRAVEAMSGEFLKDPRFVFENVDNGLTVKCVVYQPNDKIDMPYIDSESYAWMKRNLRGDNIEVHAGCDVYVVSHKTYIESIIHRFE
jgi:hypothetical protein